VAPVTIAPADVLSMFTKTTLSLDKLMGEEDVKVFEKVTIDFLNENLPDGYIVTIVEVRNQKLSRSSVRRILRELQSSPSLEIEMFIEGSGTPSTNIFDDEIDTLFEEQKYAFEDSLAAASSLFSITFDPNPATLPTTGNVEGGNVGEVFSVAGSLIYVLAFAVFVAIYVKYRPLKGRKKGQGMDLSTPSTTGAGVGSQKQEKDGIKDLILIDSLPGLDPSGFEIVQYRSMDCKSQVDGNQVKKYQTSKNVMDGNATDYSVDCKPTEAVKSSPMKEIFPNIFHIQ